MRRKAGEAMHSTGEAASRAASGVVGVVRRHPIPTLLIGAGIAWAVVEHLHDRAPGAKVLFATHFHELTQLAGRLSGVRNFHVAVREWNDEIGFLDWAALDRGVALGYGYGKRELAERDLSRWLETEPGA